MSQGPPCSFSLSLREASMPLGLFGSSKMGGQSTMVGGKKVGKEMPEEEWEESILLPGDIIEGVAAVVSDADAEEDASFASAKGRSELISLLGRLGCLSGSVWVKFRCGDAVLLLRAHIAPDRGSMLHRRFTLRTSV